MAVNRLGIVTDAATSLHNRHSSAEKKLVETIKNDKNIEDNFDGQLIVSIANNKDGASTALLLAAEPAAGDELALRSAKGNPFEAHVVTVESTGTALWNLPFVSASGLELNLDILGGINAIEISNGILSTSRSAMTVGQNRWMAEAKIKVDTIANVGEMWFGLRKAEAYQADPDNYDEMACFNIGQGVNTGVIEIHTILNNGATSETASGATALVDGDDKTFRIVCNVDGKIECYINGERVASSVSFAFDASEVVVPFLHCTAVTGDPGVSISSWKIGKL